MAKDMYEKLGMTPEAASEMTSDKGLVTFMYQMITDTRAGDSELKSAFKKSLSGGKLSADEQILINKFNMDAADIYRRISSGKTMTVQEMNQSAYPALLTMTETYGKVFEGGAGGVLGVGGKSTSQQSAELWSKIETLGTGTEILGTSQFEQAIAPRGGAARLDQLDKEVMSLTKQFAGLGEKDNVTINTDDNRKTVTVNGELYQLKTVDVGGKKEFVLKIDEEYEMVGAKKNITKKGKEIKLYKVPEATPNTRGTQNEAQRRLDEDLKRQDDSLDRRDQNG